MIKFAQSEGPDETARNEDSLLQQQVKTGI